MRAGESEDGTSGQDFEISSLLDVPPVTPPLKSSEDALEADARTIAEQGGLDIAIVRAQLAQQLEFDQVVPEVASDYPESFAGSWTDVASLRPQSFVRFKGNVPPAARDLAASFDANVTFLDNASYSLSEMYFPRQATPR